MLSKFIPTLCLPNCLTKLNPLSGIYVFLQLVSSKKYL